MRTRHLLAVFFLLAGAARAQDLNVITSVEVKDEGGSVVVSVKGSKPPNFTTFSMADPPRFVIDLSESKFQGVAESMSVEDGVVSVVKNLSYGAGATSIARVMVAFVADVEPPDVQTVGNDLVVRVAKPGGAGTAVASEGAAKDQQAEAAAEAQARAQVEAEARAQAQVQSAAEAAAAQRARDEAQAQAEAEAQARAEAEVRAQAEAQAAAAPRAEGAAEEPAPAGEKLGDEGVVVAPPEEPAASPAEEPAASPPDAAAQRAAQAKADAEAKAEAAAQARADADAARAAERQAKADAKARAAEEARAKKQAEADARAAALAEKKAKAAAAAEARAAAAAEKKAAAEAARQAAAEAKKAAAEAKAAALAAAGPSARLAEIGFKQLPGASRVFVRTSVTPRFTVTDVGDDTVRVELENTRATRRNDTRFLDTSFFPSPVALISPSMKGSAYVVDIKLRQRVPYRQKVEGDVLAIDFVRPTPAAAPAAPGEPPPAEAGTLNVPDEGTVVAPAEPEAEPAPKQ